MSQATDYTTFDRLTVEPRKYQCVAVTGIGATYDSTDTPIERLFFTFEELRQKLKQPDVLLERDYFLSGAAETRELANTDIVGALPLKVQTEVVWRYAYVSTLLQFFALGRAKRTEFHVNAVLEEIERLVNKQAKAVQGGWTSKRAGKEKVYRDAPCASTVLEWVRRFEAAGNSPLGLVPRTHLSGNRNPRFSLVELRMLGEAIGSYLTRKRRSKRQVAADCKASFDAKNKQFEQDGLPLLQVPSKRMVEREIAKLDPYTTYAARHGVEAANRKFLLYEEGIDAAYPMERVEIDEWQVDLISILAQRGALAGLSPEQLAALPRGRRWLYLAIDCATRCVVGMRLAVTPNSEDAIALLADATRDKSDLAAAAGCRSEWGHYGGLKTVPTDLGSAFVDDRFRTAIFDASGLPETPPGGLPHLRSRVERIFGTFGTNLMPGLAGPTFSNPKERGDYPSVETAAITDDTLIQMLILYVVDVYHNRPHRGLKGETPNNCWKRLAAEKGVVPDLPERIRRRAFGKSLTRKVSGKGVEVFDIHYTCAALRRFHLHSHEEDVEIKVDLNDIGWIMVRVDDAWYPARAIQKCFDGVSYDDWKETSRQLAMKYRDQATIHESTVAEALAKIVALNAADEHTFGAQLRAVTPYGLRRGMDDLHLGLAIEPDDPESFDLPPDDDLFGHVVPLPQSDSGGGGATFEAEDTRNLETDMSDIDRASTWSFDND